MRRFWLEFGAVAGLPFGLARGCGVTAYSYDDARELLCTRVFTDAAMPEPIRIVDDVDVSTLDQDHVIPNMGNPAVRGVWFPLGYG
jgi:hypothetical protein